MKKRIQVVPISSDDHSAYSARSADTYTSRSTRGRIRLRNAGNKLNKRQPQTGLFGKRPYLYKAGEQPLPPSGMNMLYPTGSGANGQNQAELNHPVHWIDWLDSGMEFFGCGIANANGTDLLSPEEECNPHSSPVRKRQGLGLGSSPQSSPHNQREQDLLVMKQRHMELMERDYVQLHEEFFDSLLKEEGDQMLASIAAATMSMQRATIRVENSSSFSVESAASSGISSGITTETSTAGDNNSSHTRTSSKSGPSVSSTRTVRLNRRGNLGKKSRKNPKDDTNFEAYDQQYNPGANTGDADSAPASVPSAKNAKDSTSLPPSVASSRSSNSKGKKSSASVLCIRDIMAKTNLESPSHYLHTECTLQKDKGRGERPGSAISARGRESALAKLRDKMKLIVEVSGELQASSVNSSVNNNSNNVPLTRSSSANARIPSGGNGGYKAMSAGMKRRRAKIASIEHSDNCSTGSEDGSYVIETRSMIELQLGFLSMQYGLLLQWDAYRTGQIVFVCLRKMCHDSFYTKIRSPPTISTKSSSTTSVASKSSSRVSSAHYPKSIMKQRSQLSQKEAKTEASQGHPPRIIEATKKRMATPPLVIRSPKGSNHAIYQRSSGATEVVLVDAPYRVPHPDVFAPSILTLDVHRLSGLDPKSRWTLIMTFDGDTEIAHLKYNSREKVFETTRMAPCKWEICMMPHRKPTTSFDVATGLEIRLFEQRPKKHLQRVANGVAGMVGGGRSSSSSYVPAGSDPFSLESPSNSYVIQNQRLIHYRDSGNHMGVVRRISRTNSENSLTSCTSAASGSTGGSSSGRGRSSKKSTSRLASTMTVPLGGLVCQPSTSQTTLWKLTIPFTHDEDAEVTLTLMHQSDYAHWLYQELRARRNEELTLSAAAPSSPDLWRLLVPARNPKTGSGGDGGNSNNGGDDDESDDETDVYFMEWLYYCCFDPR